MKHRKVLIVVALLLALSLVAIAPAQASGTGAGFNVDCTGATGDGWVPAYTTYIWSVTINYENGEYDNFSGWVAGGESGAVFNPVVEWDSALSPDRAGFVWNVYEEGGPYCNSDEGCLECPPPPPPCGEGCTPGYWKQPHHSDSWADTGYAPGDYFNTVFGVDFFDPDITLLEALKAKGGGVNALARHATAALLSAAHPDVGYPVSVAEVIELVKAGDKDTLEGYNELGCPLD